MGLATVVCSFLRPTTSADPDQVPLNSQHFVFDVKLFKGNTISPPGGNIVCLVSLKKLQAQIYGGKLFLALPFLILAKLTFGRKVVETLVYFLTKIAVIEFKKYFPLE